MKDFLTLEHIKLDPSTSLVVAVSRSGCDRLPLFSHSLLTTPLRIKKPVQQSLSHLFQESITVFHPQQKQGKTSDKKCIPFMLHLTDNPKCQTHSYLVILFQSQQIPQKHGYCDFTNGGNIKTSLLLHIVVKVLFTGEIDTNSSVLHILCGELVRS